MFRDLQADDAEDRSFTLSYSVPGGSWVFFHDYHPDFYFHTRDQLWNLKDNRVYKHHTGDPGQFHDADKKPFFIDIVFKSGEELLLESVNWVSEFLNADSADQLLGTISHISCWNSRQHSGRIALTQVFEKLQYDARRLKGQWSFNNLRDILLSNGEQFLLSLFDDFELDQNQVDSAASWYTKQLMQDNWFCVRFEFDNSTPGTLVIHDTEIEALKTHR
jgi:hypothetical protein